MARDFSNSLVNGLAATFEASDTRLNAMPCSVSCWFKVKDLSARSFLAKYPSSWILGVRAPRSIYNGAWASAGPNPVVGQAHFLGAVFNGASSAIYSEAGLVSVVNPGGNAGQANLLRIGARNDAAELFNGELCEVAFWNAPLVEAEMRALGRMISPLIVRPGALQEYWPLYGVVDQPPEPGHKNRIHAYKSGGGDIYKTKQFAGGVIAL